MSFGHPSPSEVTIRKAAMLVAPIKHASYGSGAEKDVQEDGTCARELCGLELTSRCNMAGDSIVVLNQYT